MKVKQNYKTKDCPEWSPNLKYIWTTKQIQSWIDEYNNSALYNGSLWEINHKRIFTNRYEVWFSKKTFGVKP